MNNAKRVLTFALAVCSLSAFASCGSSSDSSSKVVDKKLKEDQQQIVQRLADDMKDVRDLKSNEIKWFSHWDINPTEAEDKEIGADLALFKTKYNGKINWVQTTWETKFDDLAALVMSNDSPDFIGADDMDVFPKGAIKSMIEPIDDYIDLSKPLWTDIKGATDQFMLGDKHYVSVIRTDPAYVFVYNKQTMEDNGYDDPAELFKEGKWNWDTFTEMCLDFTDAESDKYALDGWYYEKALQQSSGVPLIGITDGKLVNNISDPMIAKAQNMMYELQKNNVVYPKHENNWKLRGDAEGSGMA
ncbi:MAG TPA: extracellular solute-binding protein, partial [Ruminococcus bicirculans (ex Wegman et al. 2014)]|nr:extracellular solute-binding protein [Ruminococcus bicirculans (ex Wegman et al. 2014)]